jgi:hypothetical protein
MYWMGHPVRDEKHAQDLHLKAALYQFHDGMPRDKAEERVKHEDRVERHQKAAAHHLEGIKAAHTIGNLEDAQRHHDMYSLHMKALGYDPAEAVPHEVARHRDGDDWKHPYGFKGHADDQFLVQPVKKAEAELETCEHCGEFPLREDPEGRCIKCWARNTGAGKEWQAVIDALKQTKLVRKAEYDVHSVKCPTCGAEAGKPCQDDTKERPVEHPDRHVVYTKLGKTGPDDYQHIWGPVERTIAQQAGSNVIEGPWKGKQSPKMPVSEEDFNQQLLGHLKAYQANPGAEAKKRILDFLQPYGIDEAAFRDMLVQGMPKPKVAAKVFEGGSQTTAPKYGHLRVVKTEDLIHLVGLAVLRKGQGDVKQFDVKRTFLRHKYLPEEKAWDYSAWLSPEQHQAGYRMFVLSHGPNNPVRVHVLRAQPGTRFQERVGGAHGNVQDGDLEVEKYHLTGQGHENKGIEGAMLNAMMGHAKRQMGAGSLSHAAFTPEASAFIEAVAKPHGLELGDIEDTEETVDSRPAAMRPGVKANRPPRAKVPQWWATEGEKGDF